LEGEGEERNYLLEGREGFLLRRKGFLQTGKKKRIRSLLSWPKGGPISSGILSFRRKGGEGEGRRGVLVRGRRGGLPHHQEKKAKLRLERKGRRSGGGRGDFVFGGKFVPEARKKKAFSRQGKGAPSPPATPFFFRIKRGGLPWWGGYYPPLK